MCGYGVQDSSEWEREEQCEDLNGCVANGCGYGIITSLLLSTLLLSIII